MKIVTLLPSATEIVCALGLRDSLVAVSHECDYPHDVKVLPAITSSIIPHDLNPEQIDSAVVEAVRSGQALYQVDGDMLRQLDPDLIITQGVCDVCAVDVGTVQETIKFLPDVVGQKMTVLSLSGANFAGVMRDIQQVAAATGQERSGSEIVTELKEAWAAVAQKPAPGSASVMMLEWPDPPFFGGHWVPEMVTAAGGEDCFGQPGRESGRCTWEEIAEKEPDYLVVMACGYDLPTNVDFAKKLLQHPIASQLRAVQNGNLWACDANSYFSRPAPRLLTGMTLLRDILSGVEINPTLAQNVGAS